ncbi:hypothetical protein [Mesobacillus foraminis]|uniref:Peptidase M48-like protein n=1 Tax=Mesobacillus foraminis TaxID=279826 RepID=A0A4R2BGB3_9BACI|nr:hypothetical protein [Mesobacillus foraminis]TCN26077.1 hypothetical protein EV146_104184 [Mesobacillus foraminis]
MNVQLKPYTLMFLLIVFQVKYTSGLTLSKGEIDLHCLCEVLDCKKYSIDKPVAILEDKQIIQKLFGLNDKWLNMFNIDSRLMTVCYESLDGDFLRFIVVYDYEYFCSDNEVKEAIIYHELGHITHPVAEKEINHQAEIFCDQNAIFHGYVSGIRKVLFLLSKMAHSLNNPLLIEAAETRTKALEQFKAG